MCFLCIYSKAWALHSQAEAEPGVRHLSSNQGP
jgi:hypothetical protein